MQLANKKIGIWGFGVVGKSAADYFYRHGCPISVMDTRDLTLQELALLSSKNIPYLKQDQQIQDFLASHDFILASPGVDLRPYASYRHKWLTELDIFCASFKKPIIAITGTVGKTTITHFLSHLLGAYRTIWTGGNIGTGMLDLLAQDHSKYDAALLELSSFQLEHCTTFAPDIALWTTFSPNHLDRHTTEQEYFNAKQQMLMLQNENHRALVPLSLKSSLSKEIKSTLHFFTPVPPTKQELATTNSIFYLRDHAIIHAYNNSTTTIGSLQDLPDLTYTDNWLAIISTLYLLNIPLNNLSHQAQSLTLPEHRLERIATINGIDFYNDSKSTTPPSTLAAINKLRKKPLLLLFGGLSKGIDRTPVIQNLGNEVKKVYCFGREAYDLEALCKKFNTPSMAFATLDQAFAQAVNDAREGDQILFSPAGASFDLFKNYKDRGEYFKSLVFALQKS